jgi:hypothetical protein
MFGQLPQYNGYLRKYIVLFGTLFNDIKIARPKDDTTIQTIKVPLTYGSADKLLARVNADPDLTRKVAAITPAMSFLHSPPVYDSARKLPSTLQRCITQLDGGTKTQFIGVPYNIDFELFIYSKEEEDGYRILEDILPNFTPGLSVTAKLVDGSDYAIDVPIILNSIDWDNQSFGSLEDRRYIIWTLRFTMKAEFAGPITGSNRKLIKIVHANIRDIKSRELLEEVYVQPGLTANGEPTTIEANSIDPHTINSDDNWGYIVEINDGANPHP